MPYSYESIECSDLPFNVFFHSIKACSSHWHAEYEIIFVLKGSIFVQNELKQFVVNTGDLCILHGGDIHLTHEMQNENLVIVLQFKPDLLINYDSKFCEKEFIINPDLTTEQPQVHKHLQELLAKMMWEKRQQKSYYGFMLETLLHQFLSVMLREVPWQERQQKIAHEEELRDNSIHYHRLRKIIAYIDQNYADKISASEVADQVGISTGYLSRFFHEKVGSSFISFVNLVRINKSLADLEKSDHKIIDIAMDVGFPSVKSYNFFFKKTYNVTPSEWRKSNISRTLSEQFEKHYGSFDNINALSLLKTYLNDV